MRRVGQTLAVVVLVVGVFAAIASAEEITRDTYRERVEPICKTNTEANRKILAGVKTDVRHGDLRSAARKFSRAAVALKRSISQLRRVSPPPADATRISKWLSDVSVLDTLFERVSKRLNAGDKGGAQRMVVRLTSQATRANAVVVPMEFHYCRLEPSRFT